MTTAAKVPLSVWCDGAVTLGVPEGHRSCPGTWEQRLPTTPPEWPPLQTYHCGCTCHATPAAFIGHRDTAPVLVLRESP